MANNENLIKNEDLTPSQRRANASKAGKASAKKRKERKTMREMLDYLLEKEITNNKGEKATTLEALMVATIKKAMTGDTRAVQFIRDTIGQAPIQKVMDVTPENKQEVQAIIDDLIGKQ